MKKRLIYILAALVILSGGFVLGYNYDSVMNRQAKSEIDNTDKIENKDIPAAVSTAGSECVVEYITSYEATNESISSQEKLDESLVGKNKEEIASYFKDWHLESFSENIIVLKRTVQGYPKGYAMIKVDLDEENLSMGQTMVYEYDEDGERILKNTIDEVPQLIEASLLKELIEGKIFKSLDEAYAYLENILE